MPRWRRIEARSRLRRIDRGDGQDDDIVGGYGNDWISGGTGQDGVLGDDGLIFTSHKSPPPLLPLPQQTMP